MIKLSSLLLTSWPGPGVPKCRAGRTYNTPAAAASAALAAGSSTSAAYEYQLTQLPLAVSVAARFSEIASTDVFSNQIGLGCEVALKEGLSSDVLQVLASAEAQRVVYVGLAVAVAEKHALRERAPTGKAPSKQQSPDIQPWHNRLLEALGLAGALELLSFPLARPQDALKPHLFAFSLQCCMSAQQCLLQAKPSTDSGGQRETADASKTRPDSRLLHGLCLTVMEALLLHDEVVYNVAMGSMLQDLAATTRR